MSRNKVKNSLGVKLMYNFKDNNDLIPNIVETVKGYTES